MPAYNAEKTLHRTFYEIPKRYCQNIILVDDASSDNIVAVARELGIEVIEHKVNKGYGANQKTCYRAVLQREAEIIVMIHPDYQYDSRLLPQLIQPIQDGRADIVLGSRIKTRREALAGGMPLYKYLGNRFENPFNGGFIL